MCVDDGEPSFFDHHVASTCDFIVHTKHPQKTHWIFGLPYLSSSTQISRDMDNIIAALGQSNRVYQVELYLESWHLERVLAPMQVSCFIPRVDRSAAPLISRNAAGHYRSVLKWICTASAVLVLKSISFPGLSTLLLSATQLVHLYLVHIPHSGYIFPEAMATLFSVLTSLETLSLRFQSPQSRPDFESRGPPPPKRSIPPALWILYFKGVTKYLEELVAHINDGIRIRESGAQV